ncbi:MAG: hypothetical protein JW908_05395 [Anaerolineales bacterium]|nr:hypothetical protein [Anaerolineales bacterium]
MMVEDANQNYINSLITNFGETYPQVSGRQKPLEDDTGETRPIFPFESGDDTVELSPQAKEKAEENKAGHVAGQTEELSEEEKREVKELKTIDRKVRAHEQAHMAAGGNLVRKGASYEYATGPDGKRYAVGGEVSIDTSEVPGDPQGTILKAERIRRAALAPADPSAQDRAVAAEAATMAFKARMALNEQSMKTKNKSHTPTTHIDVCA